jgi:hypothetical protein
VSEPATAPGRPWPSRALRAFGRFWWEFLVGDTPELFVGVLAILGLVALVCRNQALRTVAAVLVPVAVVTLLSLSIWRAARKRSV